MSEVFAGDRLFERAPSEQEVRDWTALLKQSQKSESVELLSVTVFRVGEELLALPTVDLQEVVEPCPVHKVPHRVGSLLRGMVNIRGRLELCVCLASVLRTPEARPQHAPPPKAAKFLLAGRDGKRFAFAAGQVLGIQKIRVDTLADYHEGVHVRRRFSWQDQLVGLLDLESLHQALTEGLQR